jgi:ABC-type branched-subunit amino acid transport system ATPase component
MLSVEAVSKSFGGVSAVSEVSLALSAGEMRAIIGPNGCGKTTLFNLITGYHQPDRGRILFEGTDITGLALHQVARRGIVRKFQVPSLFPALTVADNIRAAGAADPHELMQRISLEREADHPAATLAHGKKQWLELAMTLAAKPKLLLLDEPAAGMTQAERFATVELLNRLRHDTGIAIMLIEHDMKFIDAMDCEISVMDMGRIIASGSYEDMRANRQVREAYLGGVDA